jgi:F-type H+-transporting ATPase subunit a
MPVALDLNVNELFFWKAVAFGGTPFAINRVVLLMMVSSLLCLAFFFLGSRRRAIVPKGFQTLAETGYLFVRNQIAIDVIGPEEGPKYASYLTALFFFIFFGNLLEIIPFFNFPVNSRMAIPALLAGITYILFNFIGIKKQGFRHYVGGTLFPPGVPLAIKPILALIELFSVFVIRPLTLAIRLLANMMAGHVLLTIFFLFSAEFVVLKPSLPLGIMTAAVGAVLIVFEMLVISIQAYIFTMLTAFYIAEAIHGHGEEDPTVSSEHGVPDSPVDAAATAAA